MKTPTDVVEIIHGSYWKAVIGKHAGRHYVRVFGAEQDQIPFSSRINQSDSIREELCCILSEAHSLKAALDAGISRERWLALRKTFGLHLPSQN